MPVSRPAEECISGLEFAWNALSAALGAEGTAYTVLSIAAEVGAALAMGQLVSRRVRRNADQAPILAALGLAPGGRRIALAGSHVCAVGLGMLLVPLVAYLASPLTDRGLLAQVDPRGYHVTDALVMSGGTIAGLAVLVGFALAAAWRADPRANSPVATRNAPRLVLPGPAGCSCPGCGGAGLPLGAGRGPMARGRSVGWNCRRGGNTAVVGRRSSRGRHAGSVRGRLGRGSRGFGPDGTSPDEPLPRLDAAEHQLEANPGIGSILGRGAAGMLETDRGRGEVLQIDRRAGSRWPPLLAGRMPQNSHEVTVGSGVLDAHTHLGDTVTIDGQPFTIVGEHVVPQWSNGEFGATVATTGDALPPSDLDPPAAVMWVRLAKGASVETLAATVGDDVEVQSAADALPTDLSILSRIGALDNCCFSVHPLAFATLTNGLVIATKSRQRYHRTLRALGAGPSTVVGSVHWHAAIVIAISAAVGIPLGAIAGATAWHHTAHAVFVGDSLLSTWPRGVGRARRVGRCRAACRRGRRRSAARRSRQRVTIE